MISGIETIQKEERVTKLIQQLLIEIGENPEREGLVETPQRVAKAMLYELYSGYRKEPKEVFKTFEKEGYDEMIIVDNIPFHSTCEHHMLPFSGVVHVGYIPQQKIVGLSKIPRLVGIFAARLQTQERMTKQIADSLVEGLDPLGVMVVAQARHSCMESRGVRCPYARTTTSVVKGVFRQDDGKAREEFLNLIGVK